MLRELYTAAVGMLPQQTRLEVVANNIANANTPGFKREAVFEKSLIDAKAHLNDTPGDAEQNDPPTGSYIDFARGMFQQTENPLDLAIDNENGFFVVQDKAGKQFYTRAGHFNLSTEGEIITTDGKKLMGPTALTEPKDLVERNAAQIKISETGEVFLNDTSLGFIQIAKIENPETLTKVENACFSKTDQTKEDFVAQEEVSIKQGWLENSNVDIIKEMVKMIELQRMFEIGSKVIHTNADTIDSTLRTGRVV